MGTSPSDRRLRAFGLVGCAALLLLTLGPASGAAQLREVVSKQIAAGGEEAGLLLEFADGGTLEVTFHDGSVSLGGEEVGRYARGGALEEAWRALLGRAVSLDDGPLARALRDWEPPAGMEAEPAALAQRIDRTLEDAVTPTGDTDETAAQPSVREMSQDQVLTSLLGRTERLVELAEALEGMRLGDVQIHVDEDVLVERNVQLDATLISVDGDVEVEGTIRGDVVVVGGSLRLSDGGRITGDVRLADARLVDRGGEVDGGIEEIEAAGPTIEDEIRRKARTEATQMFGVHEEDDGGWSLLTPFRYIGHGLAGVVRDLVTMMILGLVGGAMIFFAGDNLEVIAKSARRAPGRAAVVGVAGTFLILPVFVLGIVALAISIIGIPVMIAWIPLFPLAVAVAMGLGFFAGVRNLGEWLARQRYPYLDWVRTSNAYTLVAGGVVALTAPFVAAHVVQMAGPWLGFLKGLLTALGVMIVAATAMVGFGAVLLTRAGRRPEYYYGATFFDDDTGWDPDPGAPPESPPGGTRPSGGSGNGPDAGAPSGDRSPGEAAAAADEAVRRADETMRSADEAVGESDERSGTDDHEAGDRDT